MPPFVQDVHHDLKGVEIACDIKNPYRLFDVTFFLLNSLICSFLMFHFIFLLRAPF